MSRLFGRVAARAMLGALVIGLLIGTVYLWRAGETHLLAARAVAAHAVAPIDIASLVIPPVPGVNVARLREKAVFYSRRTFYTPPPPSPVIAPPDYEFAGSMALPQGTRVAFMKAKADQSGRTLHNGDELDGWRVKDIQANKIVLVRDDRQIELSGGATLESNSLIHKEVAPSVVSLEHGVLGNRGALSVAAAPVSVSGPAVRLYRPPASSAPP